MHTAHSKSQPKQRQHSQKVDISDPDQNGKENKVVGLKGKGKASTVQRKLRAAAAAKKQYCVCKQPDDGTPMVNCTECKDWYHFRCVDLSEKDADEISIYVCPSCTTATGRKTVSECHWSFSLTYTLRASAPHPASCSLVENMSITFRSIISRAFFPLMAHFCLSSPCVFKQSSACAFSSAPLLSACQAPFHITVV